MKKNHKFLLVLQKYWILILVGVAVQIVFVGYSRSYYGIGFPLDDSWIHQTYARNLLNFGGWFYNLNEQSGGSTAPLWSVLLMPGHLFYNFFFVWTFLISGLFYIFSAIIFQKLFEVSTRNSTIFPWAGILFLLEWHIAWVANSGMETILFISMILSAFYLLTKRKQKTSWLLFIILGLIIYIRPDGITLMGPFLFLYIIDLIEFRKVPSKKFFAGLTVIFLFFSLYAIFNILISNEIFPNTFYAKQAEYELIYATPLLIRYLNLLIIPITGVGLILLPGFFFTIIKSIQRKDWTKLAIVFWLLGYILIYAIRLPVTYQHGRYIIPSIPIFLFLSTIGTFELIKLVAEKNKIYEFGYKVLIALVVIIFFFLGVQAYASDVAIIQTEMVEPAQWIDANLEKDAIIAAHDIGALGFYSNRKIVDLAGLISPEIIPFLRDETRLSQYLDEKNVNYLIIFPNWYDKLIENKTEIYSTNSNYVVDAGGENVKIYIWK